MTPPMRSIQPGRSPDSIKLGRARDQYHLHGISIVLPGYVSVRRSGNTINSMEPADTF
jgi:hypothetical protein